MKAQFISFLFVAQNKHKAIAYLLKIFKCTDRETTISLIPPKLTDFG